MMKQLMGDLMDQGLGACLWVQDDLATQGDTLDVPSDALDLHLDALALSEVHYFLLELSILFRALPVRGLGQGFAIRLADIEDIDDLETYQALLLFTLFIGCRSNDGCQDGNAMLAFAYKSSHALPFLEASHFIWLSNQAVVIITRLSTL